MSQQQATVRLSKRMAYVLRHNPGSVDLQLDEHGWVPLQALCAALSVSEGEILAVAAQDMKQRYTVAEGRIRAAQGHSVAVDLQHPVAVPPATLYHGTVASNLAGIRERGLLLGSRLAVHLSSDVATASAVGARRGAPVVLEVNAAGMHAAGGTFHLSENGVWLSSAVAPQFIRFPS